MQANLAAVLAVTGDVDGAEALLAQAGIPLQGPARFPGRALRSRGRAQPARRRSRPRPAAFERNVAEARFAGPAAVTHALRFLSAGEWLGGDDIARRRQWKSAAGITDEHAARAAAPAACGATACGRAGRALPPVGLGLWYLNAALLEDDPDTARRFMQVALDGFGEMGVPFFDALAALSRRRSPAATAPRCSPALAPLPRRRVRRRWPPRSRPSPRRATMRPGILLPSRGGSSAARGIRDLACCASTSSTGRVVSGNEELALRERELELLVALALERRPLSRAKCSRAGCGPTCRPRRPTPACEPPSTACANSSAIPTRSFRRPPDTGWPKRFRSTRSKPSSSSTGARRFGALSDRERARLTDLLRALLARLAARCTGAGNGSSPTSCALATCSTTWASCSPRTTCAAATPSPRSGARDALLRADVLDEPANELAIRAHVAAGRKSEALRRYRRYREALEKEYGATRRRAHRTSGGTRSGTRLTASSLTFVAPCRHI